MRARPAEAVFDDTLDWWFDERRAQHGGHPGRYQPGWYSVDVPEDRHHDPRGEGRQEGRDDRQGGQGRLTKPA